MNHEQHCDALEVEIDRFASAFDTAAPDAGVPGCPDWTVVDLASHLGTIHRWAQNLVSTLAPRYVSPDDMGLETGPVDGPWLRRGGAQLLRTLRVGDPDSPMWAWGVDQHVRFWSRRQLHETLVHRIDLQLAGRREPSASPDLAADAIDEFLVNLRAAQAFSPNVGELHGHGQLLTIRATDVSASWSIRFEPEGFIVGRDGGPGDALLAGSVLELLLVLYRRRPIEASSLLLEGDGDLVDYWIANSALQ